MAIERIEKGERVEVWTTNGGQTIGTLYESYTTSYDLTLCEHPRPILSTRISRVRRLSS